MMASSQQKEMFQYLILKCFSLKTCSDKKSWLDFLTKSTVFIIGTFHISLLSLFSPIFVGLALLLFKKYQNSLLGKNLSIFESLNLKLHNRYYP